MYPVHYGWLHGAVKLYFERHGFKLLKDDMLFIERCLSNIPPERHRQIMRGYFDTWNTKAAEKDNSSSSGVNARFEANTYLRLVCGKGKKED